MGEGRVRSSADRGTQKCVEAVYAVHAKSIQSTQAVETMDDRGKGGCVKWVDLHTPA